MHVVWIDQNSNMQSGSPNDLNAAGDDPLTETMDSEIVTLQPHGPASALESGLTDTTMDPGTISADASTPVQGQPHQFGPHNGARQKPFGLNLPTPDQTCSRLT